MTSPLFEGRAFAAFLFDMDGTVLSSLASAERIWSAWARRHGLDVAAFLPTIHGVRAIETIDKQALPGIDAEAEAAWITEAEIADAGGVEAIPGAARFLASLPGERWAIVTSAPRDLAFARLAAAGLPQPRVLLTADDVTHGKPDPECYRLAAARLGYPTPACLVFEDAEAGIGAGEAAGAAIVVITASHRAAMDVPHPTIADFDGLEAAVVPDGIVLRRTR